MENNNESQRQNFRWPRIGSVVDRSAGFGIISSRLQYSANSWAQMMLHVEQIILRGNAARMINVGGEFRITELVVK